MIFGKRQEYHFFFSWNGGSSGGTEYINQPNDQLYEVTGGLAYNDSAPLNLNLVVSEVGSDRKYSFSGSNLNPLSGVVFLEKGKRYQIQIYVQAPVGVPAAYSILFLPKKGL